MKDDSLLAHSATSPHLHQGIVNPPVYHASTIVYPTIRAFQQRAAGDRKYHGVRYGAYGTPTTFALADAVAELEGGAGAVVTATGLAAVTMAIMAFVRQGDHVLMVDTAYGPTRDFCDTVLRKFGLEDPDDLMADLEAGFSRPNSTLEEKIDSGSSPE